MVQTTVTPSKPDIDISVLLPDSYIGKEVHVVFYTDDELTENNLKIEPKKKPSEYAGTLDKATAEILLKHIEDSRNEWDRNI